MIGAVRTTLAASLLIASTPTQAPRNPDAWAIAGPVLALRACSTKGYGNLIVSAKGLTHSHPARGLSILWAPKERVIAATFAPDPEYSFRSGERQDCLFVLGSPEGEQRLIHIRIDCTGAIPKLRTIGDPIEVRGVESIACTRLAAITLLGYADGTVGVPGVDKKLSLHAGPVRALAFDETGTRFASAGRDGLVSLGSVDLFDPETVTPPARTLRDHSAGVECLAFDEEGTLASGALDGRVRFHDAAGRLLSSLDRGPAVLCITRGPSYELPFVWGDASGRVSAGGHGLDAARQLVSPSDEDTPEPITSLERAADRLWYAPRGTVRSRPWKDD